MFPTSRIETRQKGCEPLGEEKRMLLVVDDVPMNRMILRYLFEENYQVIEAENGVEAMQLIELYGDDIAIVLLDIVMPEMDGFAVLDNLVKTDYISTTPVILITGESDDEKALKGYKLGVADLINKPFNSDVVYRRVSNVIALYDNKRELERKLAEQKKKLEEQAENLKRANQFVIDALSATVEFRSLESGEHIKRIRLLIKILLQAVKNYYPLTEEQIEVISNASAVHDIGKIAIPDSILLKPGRLTDEEFEVMKSHTIRGCEILSSLGYMQVQDTEFYTYCYEICRYHHERWDGRGYPVGLVGDAIPIWAQAASLADVYDALTSKRIYKDAYSHDEAVTMILRGECGEFNPVMIDCFMDVLDKLHEEIDILHNTQQVALEQLQ